MSGKHGRLVVIEGIEGAGKSSLVDGIKDDTTGGVREPGLVDELKRRGLNVELLREPGSTALGKHLRDVLKGHYEPLAGQELDPHAEALLFCAARAQLTAHRIRPALEAGAWVVLDRFELSTLVYQGKLRGLGVDAVHAMSRFATGGLIPDATLFLTVAPHVAAERMRERDGGPADRIERELSNDRIRDGYLQLAATQPNLRSIDASGSPAEVRAAALAALEDLLP